MTTSAHLRAVALYDRRAPYNSVVGVLPIMMTLPFAAAGAVAWFDRPDRRGFGDSRGLGLCVAFFAVAIVADVRRAVLNFRYARVAAQELTALLGAPVSAKDVRRIQANSVREVATPDGIATLYRSHHFAKGIPYGDNVVVRGAVVGIDFD